MKTIFFDYDGCIHDSLHIYAPAFREAQENLVRLGFAQHQDWSAREIRQWIGLNPHEMWQRFRPDLPANIRKTASGIIGEHMLAIIESSARLFPGSADTLEYLKGRGLVLVLISNCSEAYLHAHNQAFKLDQYFKQLISTEVWQYASKTAILSHVLSLYPTGHAMVGDRGIDMEAGKMNNMGTIGARYGYANDIGEFEEADIMIDSIEELIKIFG